MVNIVLHSFKKYGSYYLFSLGFIFFIIGIFRHEHIIVLKKAIRICMECIGIA